MYIQCTYSVISDNSEDNEEDISRVDYSSTDSEEEEVMSLRK